MFCNDIPPEIIKSQVSVEQLTCWILEVKFGEDPSNNLL